MGNVYPLYSRSHAFGNADSVNIQTDFLKYDLSYSLSKQVQAIYWDTINVTAKWGMHPEMADLFEDLRRDLTPLTNSALREYDDLELPIDYTFTFFENGSQVDTLWFAYEAHNQYWTDETLNLVFRLARIFKYYKDKVDEYCRCKYMFSRAAYYYSKHKNVSVDISDLERDWETYSKRFGAGSQNAAWRQMPELFAFVKLACMGRIPMESILEFLQKQNVSLETFGNYTEFLDDEYKEYARQLLESSEKLSIEQ